MTIQFTFRCYRIMKKLLSVLIAGLLFGLGSLSAQDSLSVVAVDSFYVDTLPDSLSIAMSARNYEKAYQFTLELSQRDYLADSTLYDCADCMAYVEKYNECLEFCDNWENKYPDNGYGKMFLPIKAECYYYQRDYNTAADYLSQYEAYMQENGRELSIYYSGLLSTSLYKSYRYADAERVYDLYFRKVLSDEGLQMSEVYMSENKEQLGAKLYDYAYNSFFMGNESKGMDLLYLASQCGYEWAQQDYSHLSKCATVMMDMDLKQKYINQFIGYIDSFDFRYHHTPNSNVNVSEDFWSRLLKENVSYLELQTEMSKERRRKMLQKAWDEIVSGSSDMQYYLKVKCNPYEVSDFETNLLDQLVGDNTHVLSDFRIYPAEDPNAFATPYGHIYLTSGLVLKYHFNDNLLLGVCAHEMTHSICQHSLVNLWKQYEKERKNEIIGGIAAGLYAATMTATAIYGASNGVSYDQSFYDGIVQNSTNLYTAISTNAFYFQFKYSRTQEVEADLMAYRFCEAVGIGGYAYIMALQLLGENDIYMKADKTADHPTLAYRISFLKWLYDCEH